MTALILPRRFTHQPQELVAVNLQNPLGAHVLAAWPIAGNFHEAVTGRVDSQALGAGTHSAYPSGRAFLAPATDYVETQFNFNKPNNFTFSAWYIPSAVPTGVEPHGLVASSSTTVRLGLYQSKLYARIASTNHFSSGGTLVNGNLYHCVLAYSGGQVRLYLNGKLDYSGAESGSAAATNIALGRLGTAIANRMNGALQNVAIFGRGFGADEVRSLYQAPWQIFKPRRQVIYFDVGGGAGTTNLTIQDATHSHTADSAGLTTQWLLAVADAAHAHTADGPTLTVASVLAVAEALHSHVADNLDLSTTGATNLTIQGSAHGHTADALTLVTDWLLTIADALHSHAAENVVLSLTGAENLIVQDAAHAQAADNLGLTTAAWLAIADSVHAHLADGVTLTTASVLAILEAVHAHAAEALDLFFSSFTEAQLKEILAYVEANMAVPTTAEIAAAVWAEILSGSSAADRLVGMAAAILAAAQAAPIHANVVAGQTDIADAVWSKTLP